ncbi:MAG: T9SS type A sorting domain-containing protein, partial [Phaeodactylibacter sp.]|nr:T9SS type A sorting domain-containing protein [Phaeodactylibacter sp.]
MDGLSEMPVEDVGVLENIALQCPLEGGSAVFSARAFLAVATRQVLWHDDIECGGGEAQRLSAPVDAQPGIVEEVAIYPNPAKEQVIVDWRHSEGQVINIQLLDIYGKAHQQIPIEPGAKNCVLSISHLKAGLYMVR